MSDRHCDIHKAAGVIIIDRKLLVVRSKGKEHFFAPGGKLDPGETSRQALERELTEELSIVIDSSACESLGDFWMPATDKPELMLRMDVFMVEQWEGELTPSAEIVELGWVSAGNPEGLSIGSIFEHKIVPLLQERDLID